MGSRLADAASPYLRAHADNPVDWHRWGPEPFAEAAARDVPVLVSIGYATCHWCHVMARESFADPELAAWLNERFVAVKVDREEHAEVDATYLAAAAAFTPQLGWPLTAFATPTGRVFFAGTYFPPQPVGGVASFRQVLEAVLEAWEQRRDQVEGTGEAVARALSARRPDAPAPFPTLDEVQRSLAAVEDRRHGGFGAAPKFPVAPLLRALAGTELGGRTLDAIAASPLRFEGGGVFRYATRADWSEPHYERMLVDNAQLLAAYAEAGRADVAEGIAGFMLDVLALPGGVFASGQDSESTIDGRRVEGGWFLLPPAERAHAEPPPLDDKVVTGWNGLAVEGLAVAGSLGGRDDWIAAARTGADHLLEHAVLPDRLVRVAGSDAPATLEDHGMLATGLLALARATGDVRYAGSARDLVEACLAAGFAAPGGGDPVLAGQGLAGDAERSDSSLPSGWSALAAACVALFELTGERRYDDAARTAMAAVAADAARTPIAYGAALRVMAQLDGPHRQVVAVDAGEALAETVRAAGGILVTAAQASAFADAGFTLFAGRTGPAAYLCEGLVCRLPARTAAELEAQLRG